MAEGEDLESRPILSGRAETVPSYSARSSSAKEPAKEASLSSEKAEESTLTDRAMELAQLAQEKLEQQIALRLGTAVEDTMTYKTEDLAKWSCLINLSLTVWRRKSLWEMAMKLFLLSLAIALMTCLTVPDPALLSVSKFGEVSRFLNVFVGLLLGFFMSASVTRWWACVDGFLVLFDAIRNIQMQLIALGVEEEKIDGCLRFGVISAWILSMQLRSEKIETKKGQDMAMDSMWEMLETEQRREGCQWEVTPQEAEVLRKCEDPSGLVWIWVSSYLGHLAEEGAVPGMATPTYGRLIQLAQDAHGGIRTVRSSISVQAPFVYVQMLACLVHVNNIINAISFGLTLGTTVGTIMEHTHMAVFHGQANFKDVARDLQNLFVSFFFSCFGPFIYHALLEVSICIAQPFNNSDGEIPTWRLLRRLERDLADGKMMCHHINWRAPKFEKTTPRPSTAPPG
mmetsp:Transcript_120163/g.256431  ORF Transcript_120163/g.256431 Transcript_120163/m.256431 type:complete len:455 (-) Transcript_120163:111-1475(-)